MLLLSVLQIQRDSIELWSFKLHISPQPIWNQGTHVLVKWSLTDSKCALLFCMMKALRQIHIKLPCTVESCQSHCVNKSFSLAVVLWQNRWTSIIVLTGANLFWIICCLMMAWNVHWLKCRDIVTTGNIQLSRVVFIILKNNPSEWKFQNQQSIQHSFMLPRH